MKYKIIFCVFLSLWTNSIFADTSETEYYAILIGGGKAGYAVGTRNVADGIVTTSEDMNITIERGGVPMSIRTVETFIETTNGKPLGFETSQQFSGVATKITGNINPQGKLDIIISAMGQTQKQMIDYPEGAIMAEGMRLLQLEKGLKQGTTFKALVFSPALLSAVEAKATVGHAMDVDLFGRIVPLTELNILMETPTGSINSISYVDNKMQAKKVIIPIMGMQIELIACEKAFALSENDQIEFFGNLLVQSPIPLNNISSNDVITYHIVPKTDNAKLQIPCSDSQAVTKTENGGLTVTVKPGEPPKGATFPYKGGDKQVLDALKSTRYLQSEDKKVVSLARQAVGGTKDAALAAKQIEIFVANYITGKSLSVGYASAAEVALSRQGDCSEFSVLTAAMCRAVGIPARIVTGLVYVDRFAKRTNVFGGHAWVEAYIGGKWVGLDATRVARGFDGGHIALALGNGDPDDFFSMLNTMGCFKIEKITIIHPEQKR